MQCSYIGTFASWSNSESWYLCPYRCNRFLLVGAQGFYILADPQYVAFAKGCLPARFRDPPIFSRLSAHVSAITGVVVEALIKNIAFCTFFSWESIASGCESCSGGGDHVLEIKIARSPGPDN